MMQQDAIRTHANPNPAHDYLVQHDCVLIAAGRSLKLSVRMVPDKDIADDASLKDYLAGFSPSGARLEHIANQILEDLLNTLIPRFLHIELSAQQNGGLQRVVMEEKQPKTAPLSCLKSKDPRILVK